VRVADQRTQPLRVRIRVAGQQFGERAFIFQQAVAPAFNLMPG
jgi:hypothetical protein